MPSGKKARVSRLALCIGVSYYENFSRLSGANDALVVAEKLLDPKVGEFDRVRLVVDGFSGELKPGDPLPVLSNSKEVPSAPVDRERLEAAINGIFENYIFVPGSLLVIFFAGHGALDKSGELRLFTSDVPRRAGSKQPDFLKAFNVNDLHQFLGDKKAPKNIVLLIDACYSGAVTHLGQRLQPFSRGVDSKLQNIYLLGGARADQIAGGDGLHGYFTSCLLEAFNQRPNDGWITMGRVQEYVAEHLPLIKRAQQQIAGSNKFGINIPLVKNPLYSAVSAEFCREVQKFLRLDPDNWQVNPKPKQSDEPPAFFTAKYGSDFNETRWAIYCLDNKEVELGLAEVEQATSYLQQVKGVDRRMVVTALPVKPHLEKAAKDICPELFFRDAEKLLQASINFSEYDKRLKMQYDRGEEQNKLWRVPPLGRVYTPLRGEERFSNNKEVSDEIKLRAEKREFVRRGIRLGKDETIWSGDLEERVREWLDTLGDNRMVLIGGYGTGKSSFCKHLAAQLVGEGHKRKPVIIRLGDFAGKYRVNFRDFMESHLKEAGATGVNSAKLEKWAEAGRLLFIFDGFDEMASRSSQLVRADNLRFIESWAEITGNKVLVTTRPEYFLTRAEEQNLFSQYRRLYCHMLDRKQIDFYLQKRVAWEEKSVKGGALRLGWKTYRDWINEIYDLSDLQHRFVLLEMIVKNLPTYIREERREVTRIELYQDYLEMELNRRKVDEAEFVVQSLPSEQRLAWLEELAFRLYCERESHSDRRFNVDEADSWLRDILTPAERRQWADNQSNFLTYSFLLPAGEDQFEFSHKSFLEFLVARRLQSQLQVGDFRGMEVRQLTREIAGFVAEMKPQMEGLLEEADQEGASETLMYSAGQLRLAVRLYELSRRVVQKREQFVLDDSYVTSLEYQVFISDKANEGRYYHPHHWLQNRFAAGTGNLPVAGLLDENAADFQFWLNKRGESEEEAGHQEEGAEKQGAYSYRLPSKEEGVKLVLTESPAELRAWCGEYPNFELAGGEKEKNKQVEAALRRLPIAAEMPQAEYHSLAIARALDIAFDRARDYDRGFGHALGHALGRLRSRGRRRARVLAFNLALALDRARIYDRALDSDYDHYDHAFARTRDIAIARALALIFQFERVEEALKGEAWEAAIGEVERIQEESGDELSRRRAEFLLPLVRMAEAADKQEIEEYRKGQRAYGAMYGRLMYKELIKMETEEGKDYGELKEMMARLYWREKIVEARRADSNFPVWEGLLLVCERG